MSHIKVSINQIREVTILLEGENKRNSIGGNKYTTIQRDTPRGKHL